MDLKAQRRIAAEIMKVGVNRVYINPDVMDDVSMALTRDDIKKLIADGYIGKHRYTGVSRGRSAQLHKQKRRGQRTGHGTRKGPAGARTPSKRAWINKIRPQRRYLKYLRDNELIAVSDYRKLYLKAKGGAFRNVSHLRHTIESSDLLKKTKAKWR
ncbi:MAG: 50S ribosomal protein L19e [Candidatus Odinarchaeota archaeon]